MGDRDQPEVHTDSGEDAEDIVFGEFDVGIFAEDEDDDDADYDEKVLLHDIRDTDADVDFTDIDEDDYTFDFNVADTEAMASDDISVTESDASVEFAEDVTTQTAGDLVHFEVELEDTDEAYIHLGDEDSSFVDIIYVEDDGGEDDHVDFWLNTRTIGTTDDGGEALDNDVVVYSDDDIVESLIHSDDTDLSDNDYAFSHVDEDEAPLFFGDDDDLDDYLEDDDLEDETGFAEYLDNLDLIDEDEENAADQLVRPLQATTYDMAVDENGYFHAEDDEANLDDEIGFATLDLTEPGVESVTTWVGPSEDADEYDDIEELQEQLTERSDIALDDMLVAEFEASGIFGHMAAIDSVQNNNDLDEGLEDGYEASVLETLVETDGEGVDLTFEADEATGNQDPNELDLSADEDEVFILVNNYEGTFYVIVDTDEEPFENDLEDGESFDVELEYETDSDERFRFADNDEDADWYDEDADVTTEDQRFFLGGADGDRGDEAFPYFGTDSSQSVSTTFDFEDPEINFDNLDEDDNVQIETSDEAVVTGETNVAPGSDASVRITNAGDTPSFLTTPDAEIDSDGTVESEEIDFSDREEDDEASIDFRVSGDTVDDADGIFVEAVEEVEDDDVEEEDDDVEEEDDDVEEEDDDVEEEDDDVEVEDDDMEEDDDEPEPEDDDGVPGFGIAVALFALIAAGMLALRRQN
ncbi:BGTF surface domain-containing protein [Natrarchaeobaculum sulfurireducens]|nr:BGTF surface domain-containing protein [Natrarchaeobaculum sulfurireducens]